LKHVHKRLTYMNVMSTIAVLLTLGGATAFAAAHLGKNSVGTRQLKKNSVTAAKIRRNAVTAAKVTKNAVTAVKIKKGAVNGSKIADGSVTGADVDVASMPFSRIVARLRTPSRPSLESEAPTPLGSYTQAAGEDDQYFAGADVSFAPSCVAPREAILLLAIDPADPGKPKFDEIAGIGFGVDEAGATPAKHVELFGFPIETGVGMTRMAPASATSHSFYVYGSGNCKEGAGITASNIRLDVVGTK
jgi:hypothetical protein